MLEFRNVSKSFWTGTQHKVILDRASFRVDLGESMGILAPNGTGKTTVVNMMAGLEKPDEGEIIRGCKISFPLGFMGGVISKLSAMENARYIARLYGLDPDYVEAFCRWLCGLEEYFDQPLGTYSAGMKSRFTFALMLALDFDIYLIDEIISVGDRLFKHKSKQMLQEHIQGSKIFLVSHQEDTVREFCDKCILLRSGNIEFFEDMDEAFHTFNNIKTR